MPPWPTPTLRSRTRTRCWWAAKVPVRRTRCTRRRTRACAFPCWKGGARSTSPSPRPWCLARRCDKPAASIQPHGLPLDDAGAAQAAAFLKMATQQGQVLEICPEQDVEGVADDRHHPKQRIDGGVGNHASDHPARSTKLARFPDQIARDQRGDKIAGDRHQADDGVEPDADLGAGYHK